MRRGRKTILEGGRAVRSFSLTPLQASALDSMENASRFVREVLDAALVGGGSEILDLAARRKDLEILELEGLLLQAKTERAGIEERRRVASRRKENEQDARMRLLEAERRSRRGPRELRNFLTARSDLVVECGFPDAEAAARFVEEASRTVVR